MAKVSKQVQVTDVALNYINVMTPNSNFNPANPDYNVTWKMSPKDGKAFIAEVEDKIPEFKGKVPSKRDDEDNYIFKAKQKKYIEWVKDGEKQSMEVKPRVLNADNTPYEGREPWGGTVGDVAMELRATRTPQGKPMLALTLKGVRIKSLYLGDGSSSGDGGDPLFANNVVEGGNNQVQEVLGDFEDDVPFN
jgi:hypothetical protein